MHGFETLQEQTPEQAREHANWQKEAGPAGNPSLAVRRYAAARNDTVHMRMVLEVLAPAVQDSSEPMSAPRCLRSAAMVVSVSAAGANSRPQTMVLFWNAIAQRSAGR